MKKIVFLMTPVLALLVSGCLSAGSPLLKMSGGHYALTSSKTPEPLYGNDARGVRLSISPHSSLNIDVEGILDYVQGGSVYTPEYETENDMYPWIRFNYTY